MPPPPPVTATTLPSRNPAIDSTLLISLGPARRAGGSRNCRKLEHVLACGGGLLPFAEAGPDTREPPRRQLMGDLGFWALAQEDPDYLALVTPEGDEVKSGELLGRANQLVHALRTQGFGVGDRIATLLPNGAEMIEIYLAALQAGWYLVPINFHLVAPEVAYILKDSGAKAFVAHERFADVAAAAADETGIEPAGRLAVGDIAGFASYD